MKLTYCHFSGIQEQTPSGLNQIDEIFSESADSYNDFKTHSLDMRCIYSGKHVKVITPGGQEFVIPMEQDVVDVYAIENGIILKARYNED